VIGLLLLPAALSLLVLGAHFLRAGNDALIAIVLVCLGLLGVRRRWAAWVVQGALLIGAVEWIRTTVELVKWRTAAGQPATRLVVILGGVTLWTLVSAVLFRSARLRRWYSGDSCPTP
jgi:hypothetical protein